MPCKLLIFCFFSSIASIEFFNKLELSIEDHIKTDKRFLRAEELKFLKGDCTKAQKELGWKHEYTFETMLDEMIEKWQNHLS